MTLQLEVGCSVVGVSTGWAILHNLLTEHWQLDKMQ